MADHLRVHSRHDKHVLSCTKSLSKQGDGLRSDIQSSFRAVARIWETMRAVFGEDVVGYGL